MYKNALPALVDHLHGEHDFHSPIIAEPFIFISRSLPRVSRPLSHVFVSEKKSFDLRKVFAIDLANVGVQVYLSSAK